MTLDALLRPIRWMDERILSEYSRAVVYMEKKRVNKYILALGCDLLAMGTSTYASILLRSDYWHAPATFLVGLDFAKNTLYYRDSITINGNVLKDDLEEKTVAALRLPFFLAGTAFVADEIWNMFSSANSGSLAIGYYFLSMASSWYIHTSDPTHIKQPLRKKINEWLRNPTRSPVPSPISYNRSEAPAGF